MRFRYNFMISNDFIMRINLKVLLIIKRIISLIVNINKNKEAAISSLNISNNRFIISFKSNTHFKSNAFKTIITFNEVLLEIKMKLNKLLTLFSIIIYLF